MKQKPKPSREDVLAAAGRTVPDVTAPGLRLLFCGINPGLYGAAVGRHFARPVDLLPLRRDGRLVIVELKVSENAALALQRADYWRRVEMYRFDLGEDWRAGGRVVRCCELT